MDKVDHRPFVTDVSDPLHYNPQKKILLGAISSLKMLWALQSPKETTSSNFLPKDVCQAKDVVPVEQIQR